FTHCANRWRCQCEELSGETMDPHSWAFDLDPQLGASQPALVGRLRAGLAALGHRRSAHLADGAAGDPALHDTFCAAAGGLSFPAPGAGNADDPDQPDTDRT